MKKHVVRLHKNNHDAHLIFHATPATRKINPYDLFEHQWYITEDENTAGFPIEEENFEIYATTTELIKEKDYDSLYLYCKHIDKKTNLENNTEFIRLYSDVNKILDSETIFDDISAYDENGDFIKKIDRS